MAGHRLKIFVLVTLLAYIAVTSASTSMSVATGTNSLTPTKRLLRTDVTVITASLHVEEERKLAVSLPGIDQLITSIKSGTTKLIQKIKLKWWGIRNKSPDYVFTSLKLDQTGGNLFESPAFSKWVTFVTARNTKNPEVAMFSTLSTHYTDDALAKMLAAAKEVDTTKDFAGRLQGIQRSTWANAGRSTDDVYKLLKLDQAGDNLFESPVFSTWASYVSTVNKQYPNEVILAKLSDQFGDVALAKMIAAATKNDKTEKLATELRTAQFQHWKAQGATPTEVDSMLHITANSDDAIKKVSLDYEKFYGKIKVTAGIDPAWVASKMSVDDVFKFLKLDKADDKLFENPDFSRWAAYVLKVDKSNADDIMLAKLADQYGDVTLAKMIASATKVDATEKLATDLRAAQFKNWLSQGATPKEIDSMLHITSNSDDAIRKVSLDYEKFYGKIKVTTGFDPAWVASKMSVDDVFKLLKLDKADDKLFEKPDFSRWAAYVLKVDKRNADDIMLAKLTDQYGDAALAKMIASAAKVDGTEKLARGLRAAQFKNWLIQGATPKEIDSLLHVTANSDDVLKQVSRDYEKIYGKIKVEA